MFTILILLFVLGWWFLWKKKYYILIESAGENADGMKQVFKTQLELSLTDAEAMLGALPKLVRGGNLLNACLVVKAIKEAGGTAKIPFYWVWQSPLGKQPKKDANGKKIKQSDPEEKHASGGYVFTPEDVDAAKGSNDKAYAKLVEAMEVGGDNFYPETLAETQKMDALLDESEKAAKNMDDPEYYKLLNEMRGIVGWSARRHFNFSWGIILGSIVTIGFMTYFKQSDKEEKLRWEGYVAKVEAWNVENDTITLEKAMGYNAYNYDNKYYSPNCYKAAELNVTKASIENCEKYIEEYKQRADTAKSKDLKKSLQNSIEKNQEQIAEWKEYIAEVNKWDLKDSQEAALKDAKKHLKWANEDFRSSLKWFIFFIILIPLYIIANFSWGYNITRHRVESKVLSKIHGWIVSIGIGFIAAGWMMELLPDYIVTTYWSDGRTTTHTESDPGNIMVICMKIGLILLGLIIIAFISSAIMIYSTIVGLIRNYNWKAIFSGAKNTAVKVADKAKAAKGA